jgi:beta-lactamase class A
MEWLMLRTRLDMTYQTQKEKAGGTWHSLVRVADATGALAPVVSDDADTPVWAYSVNKIAVAIALLDKVDRGQLRLDQKLELTPDIIAIGSGIYHLQGVYGDELTLANLMTAMLLMSDNTAVRMLSKVVPGPEVNAILASKGFSATHVDPIPGSTRFFLGQTTAREMNLMLEGIANHTLISEKSAGFMLGILRWVNGYNDGVRRNMSSVERAQVATKYGAFEDSRHEVGILFDALGKTAAVYTFFTENVADIDNYGATNPAVEAQASIGRGLFDIVNGKWTSTPGRLVP